MNKPDLLAELNYRCEDLSAWFWGTLVHYESRSADEINLVASHIIEQNKEEIQEHRFHWLWDDFEDHLRDWVNDVDSFHQFLNFDLNPRLEIAEYALIIGVSSISLAMQKLQSKAPSAHYEAALCYAQALEARAYWINLSGLNKCRNPDPAITLAEQNIKALELDMINKAQRVATAKKAANARHSQAGGTRDKADEVRRKWATGKYQSRNQCAEKVAPQLGISVKAARNALMNTPDP